MKPRIRPALIHVLIYTLMSEVLLGDRDDGQNKMGQVYDKDFCKTQLNGLHAVPGDCRAYYDCSHHKTYYYKTGLGNVFDDGDKREKQSWTTSSCSIKKVLREVWKSVDGRDVEELVYGGRFPCAADEKHFLDTMCYYKNNYTDNYGQRMRAFFKAPMDGMYTFRCSCDDSCQLWLSTDRNPENKRLIHNQKKPTSRFTWQSAKERIGLEMNKVYYMEVLQKEFVGPDFVCVGVTLPSDSLSTKPILAKHLVMGPEELQLLGCTKENGTNESTCDQKKCLTGKVHEFEVRMDSIITKLTSVQDGNSPQTLQNITEECADMVHTILEDPEKDKWRASSDSQAMQIALKAEEFGRSLALVLNNATTSVESKRGNVAMQARTLKEDYDSRVYGNSDYIKITTKENEGENAAAFSAIYSNLNEFLPQNVSVIISNNRSHNSSYKLNSRIVGGLLTTMDVFKDVTVSFRHIKSPEEQSATSVCVWWDFSVNDNKGRWSTTGCELLKSSATRSTCRCSHLTNFAVLMQVNPNVEVDPTHKAALEIITYVGCSLSLLGVFLTVLTIACLSGLRSERNLIHLNLSLSIGIFQVIFLAGIEATNNKAACAVVAAFLHYFSLVVFAWMLVEGIYLYVMIITVFEDMKEHFKLFIICAYGFPAVVVAIALGIAHEGYGTTSSCWLSPKNGVIYGFISPAVLIILVNTVILAMVIKEIVKIQTNGVGKTTKVDLVRSGLKSAVVLLPLLGITWTFGLLALSSELIAFQYLFAIFNSLQGFFIFIFHCAMNSEVRRAIRRKKEIWDSRRSNLYPSSLTASTAVSKKQALDKTTEFSAEARIVPITATNDVEQGSSYDKEKNSNLPPDGNFHGSGVLMDRSDGKYSDVLFRNTSKHAPIRLPPVSPPEKKSKKTTSSKTRKDSNRNNYSSSSVAPAQKNSNKNTTKASVAEALKKP